MSPLSSFKNKSSSNVENEGLSALLGKGSNFEGSLTFEGKVCIDGKYTGEIKTDGEVILGKDSNYFGDIFAGNVIVNGYFEGNITASVCIFIKKGCSIKGNIFTKDLVVEKGSFFEGNCRMFDNVK